MLVTFPQMACRPVSLQEGRYNMISTGFKQHPSNTEPCKDSVNIVDETYYIAWELTPWNKFKKQLMQVNKRYLMTRKSQLFLWQSCIYFQSHYSCKNSQGTLAKYQI